MKFSIKDFFSKWAQFSEVHQSKFIVTKTALLQSFLRKIYVIFEVKKPTKYLSQLEFTCFNN